MMDILLNFSKVKSKSQLKSLLLIILLHNIHTTTSKEVPGNGNLKIRRNVKNIGGDIFLGQLYDGTRDARIPGEFLWHRNEMVIVNGSNAEKVRDHILEEHSLLDRLNLFKLDVELKVSFMGGLVEVEG